MEVRGAEHADRARVLRRDVANVGDKAITRVESVETPHHPIPDNLRDDRGRGDGRASRITVHERLMRRRRRTEAKPVHETCVCRRMEIGEDCPKRR